MKTRARKAAVTFGFFVVGLIFMAGWVAATGELFLRGSLGELGIMVAIVILLGGLFGVRTAFLAALPGERDAED